MTHRQVLHHRRQYACTSADDATSAQKQ
jgi:hypothetical protein